MADPVYLLDLRFDSEEARPGVDEGSPCVPAPRPDYSVQSDSGDPEHLVVLRVWDERLVSRVLVQVPAR